MSHTCRKAVRLLLSNAASREHTHASTRATILSFLCKSQGCMPPLPMEKPLGCCHAFLAFMVFLPQDAVSLQESSVRPELRQVVFMVINVQIRST